MMLECPRCGFVQPKDRYCANCGLDVENYKEKPKALHTRIATSPLFHLSLAAVVIALTAGYILMQPSAPEPETEIYEEPETVASTQQPKPVAKKQIPQPRKAPPPKVNTPAKPKTAQTVSKAMNPMAVKSEQKPKAKTKTKAESKPTPTKLNIRYAELTLDHLNTLLTEGTSQGGGPNFRALTFNHSGSLGGLSGADTFRFLPGTRSNRLTENRQVSFSYITPGEDGAEYGLNLQINPIQVFPNQVRIDIEGFFQMKSAGVGGQLLTSAISGSFTIPKGQVLLIVGFIPHQPGNEEQLSSMSGNPVSILNSEEFQQSNTEFAILLQSQ